MVSPYESFLGRQFLGTNPGAAFYHSFPQAGGASGLGEFLRGSQSRLYNAYLSQLPKNPNLLFQDFLKNFDLVGQFNQLAPQLRGERVGVFQPRLLYGRGSPFF